MAACHLVSWSQRTDLLISSWLLFPLSLTSIQLTEQFCSEAPLPSRNDFFSIPAMKPYAPSVAPSRLANSLHGAFLARLAAGAASRSGGRSTSLNPGVICSSAKGELFEFRNESLPDRVSRLPLGFAGERLIVGTAGSGIFFIDLPRGPEPPHQTEAD